VDDLQARPALTIVPAILAGAAVAAIRRRQGPISPDRMVNGAAAAKHHDSRPARIVVATVAIYVFIIACSSRTGPIARQSPL